jgi:hypothetical protein
MPWQLETIQTPSTTLAVLLMLVRCEPMTAEWTSDGGVGCDPGEDGSPDGGQCGLWRRAGLGHFFPLRQVGETEVLEEGEGDHDQNRVMVQAVPTASLEVIETEFLLHLLVPLFHRPSQEPLKR